MPKPYQTVTSQTDGRLLLTFHHRHGHIVERVVRPRSVWWLKLFVILQFLVRRDRAHLLLLPERWMVTVDGGRMPVRCSKT